MPDSVQLVGVKVPEPPDFVKLTVPVGVVVGGVSVSVTVAVQLVDCPTTTDPGVQPTLVLVVRLGGSVTSVLPLLPACVASPP
jgi:hypothetical protein